MKALILIIQLYIFMTCLLSEQIRPISGSVINYTRVLFEWEQEPNASYYHFQLSDDIMFTNIINSIYDSTLIIILNENLERENNYYWRVRPYYPDNSYGAWLDTLFFKINESLFDEISTEIINVDKIENGEIIFSSWHNPTRRTGIFDNHGNEIWNDIGSAFMMTNIDKYGHILGSRIINSLYEPVVYELNNNLKWDGDDITINPHDFIQLPNGNYMGFQPVFEWGYVPDGWDDIYPLETINWKGTRIIEWDKETKEELWTWNVFDYYNIEDYDSLGYSLVWSINESSYDWLHTNSIYFDENESAIYISHRNISRITKIAYPSGEIIWMMGLPSEYMSLTLPAGNDEHICTDLLFSFQHHLTVLENGHLLFFDNSRFSNLFFEIDEKISRVLEISVIDNNYCELIWEYDLSAELYSDTYGSVQLLNNGNYLINSKGGNGTILEITPNKEIVFQASTGLNTHNYRAFRIPSIHPDAFSILIGNLKDVEIGNYVNNGIILTENYNILSIHIHNESGYNHQFNYFLSDDSNWLNNLSDKFLISSHSDTTIFFEVNFNQNPFSNVNFKYNFLPHQQDSLIWTIYKGCDSIGNVLDCAGECDGSAIVDECGECNGDGVDADNDGVCDDVDDCIVEDGASQECGCNTGISEGDCDCDGNVMDACSVCGGGNSTCTGCMNDTACNYNIDAIVEGVCEYPQNNYDCDANCIATDDNLDENGLDCSDICGGGDISCLAIRELIIPQEYNISSIYPNPFNPVTNITYGLPEYVNVQIAVYNLSGKQVETLINEFQVPGYHSVNWNADNLPSGVYLIRMDSGDFTQTQKVVLVK